MDSKAWWWVGGFVLLVAVIVAGVRFFAPQKAPVVPALADVEESKGANDEEEGVRPTFDWEFAPAGGNAATGASFTHVSLLTAGDTHDLGTFPGPCSVIEATSTWPLVEDELTGIVCEWGGAGQEVGVFYEDGVYVIKKGDITDAKGDAAAQRGDYEIQFTL